MVLDFPDSAATEACHVFMIRRVQHNPQMPKDTIDLSRRNSGDFY